MNQSHSEYKTKRLLSKFLLICLVANCVGCQPNSTTGRTVAFLCDISGEGVREIETEAEISIEALQGVTWISTGLGDSPMDEDHLKSWIRRVWTKKPTLVVATPNQTGAWIYYIAHNIKNLEVTIRFVGKNGDVVEVDGQKQPLSLAPGVHGFQVDAEAPKVQYAYLPLDSPPGE